MDPYLGEIRMFAGNFAPRGWAFCNGQILSIAQNTALFSLLGTTYGGNGQTTFALPNLQSMAPLHWGNGAGLSPYSIGQTGGAENVTLIQTQMPGHTHTATTSIKANGRGDSDSPAGAVPGGGAGINVDASAPDGSTRMSDRMAVTQLAAAGGNQPHANLQPYLAVTFIIALEGIYPSRS